MHHMWKAIRNATECYEVLRIVCSMATKQLIFITGHSWNNGHCIAFTLIFYCTGKTCTSKFSSVLIGYYNSIQIYILKKPEVRTNDETLYTTQVGGLRIG